MNRLRLYRAPGMLIVVAVFCCWWGLELLVAPYLGEPMLLLGIGLYVAGSVWWLLRSVAPGARLWPNGLIVWVIELPWVVLALIELPRARRGDDYAQLGESVAQIPATLLGVACVAVTSWLIIRTLRLRAQQSSIS
jgi:hypothetical protein